MTIADAGTYWIEPRIVCNRYAEHRSTAGPAPLPNDLQRLYLVKRTEYTCNLHIVRMQNQTA